MKKFLLYALCIVLAVGVLVRAGPSQADSFFSFKDPSSGLAASVNFHLEGNTLTVTLTNTATSDVMVPTDVLTGVFFNTTSILTPGSVSPNGSSTFYAPIGDINTGWGYASGVNAQGKNSAISASGAVSGLGFSNFNGTHTQLQGLDYGILSAGDNSATGNGGVTGKGPLIKNSVMFTFDAPGFALTQLGDNVLFQYGTSVNTHATPEPSTLILAGFGLVGLWKIRKKQKK